MTIDFKLWYCRRFVIEFNFIEFINRPLVLLSEWLICKEHFGVLRFNLVRIIYRMMTNYPDKRNKTWDFVLNHLPELKMVYWRGLRVLDIGCRDSLLIYEIARRGYHACGLDIRGYHVKLPKKIQIYKANLLEPITEEIKEDIKTKGPFSFIVSIGTIELVGTEKYHDGNNASGDRRAMQYLYNIMDDGGYFFLALPTEGWRFVNGRGYTFGDIVSLISGIFHIIELSFCGGNICMVLVKIKKQDDKTAFFVTNNLRYKGGSIHD